MGSPDQETLQRRSPKPPLATEYGTETAAESRLSCTSSHMATGGCCPGASPPLVVVSGSARDLFDESVYEGSEAPPLWADVPADILGLVLRLLPCVADRASVRSVCRHWRAAASAQVLPAPLPVLVLPRLIRLSCLTSDGALTAARRAQMPDNVRIVGSCDDWLMAVKKTGECFLVNAFSSEVVHLPCLPDNSKYNYICLDEFISARLVRGFCLQSGACLLRSALSSSPSYVSKYTVAALTYSGAGPDPSHPGLAIWQPGMKSWYLCLSSQINSSSGDLAFYKGKLYMVWKYSADIFAFELREDELGVSLSSPKHYRIYLLIPSKTAGSRRCNMVEWRGKLLLVIRFFSHQIVHNMECNLLNVEVFALDFSTSPCGVTQIHNFDGDCIFVQKSGCKSFSAGLHLGVPVPGDLIYFSDEDIINHVAYTYVHNMRDGTRRRIAAGLPLPNSGVPEESFLDFPLWIFPSS